jgi:hypothetical protein
LAYLGYKNILPVRYTELSPDRLKNVLAELTMCLRGRCQSAVSVLVALSAGRMSSGWSRGARFYLDRFWNELPANPKAERCGLHRV